MKLIKQTEMMNCGPTCLAMVSKHYGKKHNQSFFNEACSINKQGVSLLNLSQAAEAVGFRTLGVRFTVNKLIDSIDSPCIIHRGEHHFAVLYKIKAKKFYIADPLEGKFVLNQEQFNNDWVKTKNNEGYALLLEPSNLFYSKDSEEQNKSSGFSTVVNKVKKYKSLIWQLIIGVLAITVINVILPFLSQSLIDQGVSKKDYSFISLILIAQLVFIFSRTVIEFIRSWILLHISTRVNISIMADFLLKLMKLPLSFFDKKNTGDILQRISDHDRIEQLLTSHSLNTLFSILNLIVFGFVLWIYSGQIFQVFCIGSILSLSWPLFFLKNRKKLDKERFSRMSNNKNYLMQLIHGMPEIKLSNSTTKKKWQWEDIQLGLFKVKTKVLKIEQIQQAGTILINEVKNILVIFLSAQLVINGELTFGMLIAITYILGQLNSPIDQLINFIPVVQDAQLSLQRLGDIQNQKEESEVNNMKLVPPNGDIEIHNMSFSYPGFQPVLNKINISIPFNKTTAIVGESGSGKTTLMKMLLKFYPPNSGSISIGGIDYEQYPATLLRGSYGAVFQDGFIFDDTIANNVALDGKTLDYEKLEKSLEIANLRIDVNRLPLRENTKIGQNGQINLSKGQQQRLMIARSIYQDPDYLFYDEATSALDANNEKVIQENLSQYLVNKTSVIIAHRLSTVKNADQIIVLRQGQVVECGDHSSLSQLKGYYYNLVKNQLELGA